MFQQGFVSIIYFKKLMFLHEMAPERDIGSDATLGDAITGVERDTSDS